MNLEGYLPLPFVLARTCEAKHCALIFDAMESFKVKGNGEAAATLFLITLLNKRLELVPVAFEHYLLKYRACPTSYFINTIDTEEKLAHAIKGIPEDGLSDQEREAVVSALLTSPAASNLIKIN